jgi:hypothetical protein
MLTYLDRTASQHFGQDAHGFIAIAFLGDGTLTIQAASGLLPGQIVDGGELLSPEDGGAMDASVGEAFQRGGPGVGGTEW